MMRCLVIGTLVLSSVTTAQTVEGTEPNRGGEVALDATDPDYSLSRLQTQAGYRVNLWASERDFPLHNPVAFEWDGAGRLWVATMPSYPQYDPGTRNAAGKLDADDRILILEDTDGDGVADKHTVFADGLHVPTGLALGDGGVYVAQQPNLMYLADTDGDDRADVRRIVLHGFGTEDSHHAISAFTWGPGGGLYFQEGTFHHTQVETPWGPTRCVNAGVFRYEPTTEKVSVFVSYGFANPWGHVFDRWGQSFVADASGGANYFATAFSGHVAYPRKHAPLRQFTKTTVRPTAGCEFVSSRHFPEDAQGNWLLNNCIGFHGVKQYRVEEVDSGFLATETEPLLFSTDINFRPVDLEFGPDGALYLCDWFNPLIGHMQYSLRDPQRDHAHGRIWRVSAIDRPTLPPVKIAGATVPELLELLKAPEDRTRYRVRLELRTRPREEVLAALATWVDAIAADDPDREHHLLEALWVRQHLDALDEDLLRTLLAADDFRARAAATRVLQHWGNRIDGTLFLLERLANDAAPRVRLEAVRACSFFGEIGAAEIALDALRHPTDEYIDYTLRETMLTLQPSWLPVLERDETFCAENRPGLDYVLALVDTDALARLPRNRAVCLALLARSGVPVDARRDALVGLAGLDHDTPMLQLVAAIERTDAEPTTALDDLIELLLTSSREDLVLIAPQLGALAQNARQPAVRAAASAAMVLADRQAMRAWAIASRSVRGLIDFLAGIPHLSSRELRAPLVDRVIELTTRLPTSVGKVQDDVRGRYVRISLPRPGTLTLAEVEVFTADGNVALDGIATQSSIAWQGAAERAIDGNIDGAYSSGSSSHTLEDQADPWWEVDLGGEHRIDSIAIWNRTDAEFAARLDGYRLSILDADRTTVFEVDDQPAPQRVARFEVGGGELAVQRAAIAALAHLPGKEATRWSTAAGFVGSPPHRDVAIDTLRAMGVAAMPVPTARITAAELAPWLAMVEVGRRGEPAFENAVALCRELLEVLPPDERGRLFEALQELDRVKIRIATIAAVMRYDVTEFTVLAGKNVELEFVNDDAMPHNLLVAARGALEKVGTAAEKMAARPDAFERHFVPDLPEVLAATRLLQPNERQKVTFVAPDEPGDYPFVCTFPGHWRTMNGIMRVVRQ